MNSIDSTNLNGIDSVENTNVLSSNFNEGELQSVDSGSNDLSESYNADSSAETTEENAIINSAENDNSEINLPNGNGETDLAEANDAQANLVDVNDVQANLVEANEVEANSVGGESKISTDITVSKTSIIRGTDLYIYLKDSHGNPISGKELTLTINKVEYKKTTNNKGAVSLPFKKLLGEYTLKVHFNGDSEHLAKTSSFLLNIHQLKTKITVSRESVPRGRYFYAYLKDSSGKALSNKKITIVFKGKKYIKTSNSKGRVSLKMSSVAGKYPIKVLFAGSTSYKKANKNFTLKIYRPATKISIASKSVIRGKYLYAYLKDSAGNALKSKPVTIKFDNVIFHRTTNKNGRVALQIKTKLGTFPCKITYAGSDYYKASSKSFKLKSYVAKTKITASSSVIRGKYFYVYLKDDNNKPASGEKVVITINGKKFTKTTNANGRAALLMNLASKNYAVKINHAASRGYKAASKSLTVHVLPNVTAKIIAKGGTYLGEYSIRLTDLNGNPLSGQTIKIVTSSFNHAAGSLKKITQKTIIIDTDVIFTETKDKTFMNNLASALRAKGYKVIVSGRGPNEHCNDIKGKYSNAVVLCLFGGADSGMFYDMSSSWYQNLLKKYNNRVVLGFLDPPNKVNLATCTWLKRARDDNYSPKSFTGLSYPGTYLNNHGMDYIYGKTANQMAENFVKYAVNGLSIGLDNTIPSVINTYSIVTNSEGYATVSGLASGTYTMEISYSNPSKGYIADTVKVKVEIK